MTTGPDFTIADILTWARAKPADGRYTYGDLNNCALCQFLRETGRAVRPSAGGSYWDDKALAKPINHNLEDELSYALIASTFGDLANGLAKLIPPSKWARADTYLFDIEQVPA